jgi:hypothetical protein
LADYARCLLKEGLLWSIREDAFTQRRYDEDKELETLTDKVQSTDYIRIKDLEAISQGGNADRFLDTAATVGSRRARFTTSRGMSGIGPECMKQGDLVCILYGADVPFIIRPNERSPSDPSASGEEYQLMGESYVLDLMHGEAIKRLDDPKAETVLQESWIELC